jgi:hypothetical protein
MPHSRPIGLRRIEYGEELDVRGDLATTLSDAARCRTDRADRGIT